MQAHGSKSHKRLKQKKDAEASSFQCSGNRTRTCVRRSGYEPEVLLTRVKQKRMPKHPLSNVAGTGLEPVTFGL